MTDKEPEVRSEAIGKLALLAKYCSSELIVEKFVPIILNNSSKDMSQHVRGSLAQSVCELAQYLGKDLTLSNLIEPVTALLKD